MASALVLLAEGFEDVEAVTAIDVLRRAGVEVTAAGLTPGLIRGARGTAVQPDTALSDVKDRDYDALVLPGGGPGSKNLAASTVVKALVTRFQKAGKLIGAICAAPAAVLGPAGILEGKTVTGFPGTEKDFPPSARFKADPVVVDGNLVTSRALGTSLAFSLALVEKLAGRDKAEEIRRSVLG